MGNPEGRLKREDLKLCMDVVQEARTCLAADLARHPEYADLHHMSALLQVAQAHLATAETALQRALETNPRYAAARATLAHVYLNRGRFDQAAEIFGALKTDDPTGTEGHYGLGLVDLHRDRLKEASTHLEACIELTGRRVPWLHRLAVVRRRQGDRDGALTLWREAAQDPLVTRFYERAGLHEASDIDDETLDRMESLIPTHTGLAELEDYYARICARTRLWGEAAEAYRRAYLAEGVAARYHTRMGSLAALKGDDAEAIRCYETAVKTDPSWVPARVALGFEHAAQGDSEQALEQFEEAARLRPRWADVHYNLGLLYSAQGRHEEAQERFKMALAINPNYAHAQASLAFTCFNLGMIAEARKELEKSVALGVRSSDLYVHLATCYRDLGDPNKAVEALQEAVALNPNDEMAHYHLGCIHHQRGSRRRATTAWKQFLLLAQKGPLYEEIEAKLRSGTDD